MTIFQILLILLTYLPMKLKVTCVTDDVIVIVVI